MQRECGKNTNCVKDGASFKCECKDGYIFDDGECVGMSKCCMIMRLCLMTSWHC